MAKENFKESLKFDLKLIKYRDEKLAKISVIFLLLTILGIIFINVLEIIGIEIDIGISEISLIGVISLLVFAKKRREIIAKLDWSVLILFAALFVLMKAGIQALYL